MFNKNKCKLRYYLTKIIIMTQVFFIMLKLSRKRQNHIKKTRKLSKIYKEDILKTNI